MKTQENTPQNNSIWEKAKAHKEKTKENNRP